MRPAEPDAARAVELEGRFSALITGLQVGVVVQGPGSEILLANPKAIELLGLTQDQLLGRSSLHPSWDIVREDGQPFTGHERPVFQALEHRVPIRDVIMGVLRPGEVERVWLLVTAVPQLRADGSVVQVVATFTDITRQRRTEETVRAQVQRIRELSTPVIPIDADTLIAPLVGAMDRERAELLLETLLEAVVRTRSRVVIVDVTGVAALEDVVSAAFQRSAEALRLLGARMILTGVRPTIASLLVEHDVRLGPGVQVFATLQQGVAAVRAHSTPARS